VKKVARIAWTAPGVTKVEDTLSNLGEGANAAEPDVVDPAQWQSR